MYKIVFLKKADSEMFDALEWYEDKQEDLGERFISEVKKSLETIKKQPDRYAVNSEGYRQIHLNKFPYLVIYKVDEQLKEILITSIFHTKRNPSNKYRL